MKNSKRLIGYLVLAFVSCTLMGNTTDTGRKQAVPKIPAPKAVYDSTVQALQDSIDWYRTNWRLNEDLLSRKRQSRKSDICN